MKFNALVVAAMVITSVNAAGKGGFWSCFGLSCGPKSRVPRDRQVNEQQPGLSRVPRDSQVNEQQPAMPQNTAGNGQGSGSLRDLPDDELDEPQEPWFEESKGDGSNGPEVNVGLICYTADSALKYSHEQMEKIVSGSNNQQLVSSDPNDKTKESKTKKSKTKKPKTKQSKTKETEQSPSHYQPTPEQEERKCASLKENYDKAREEFVKYDCSAIYPDLLSPEKLTEMDKLFY
ncbi:hypothetical protein BASA84_000812 [Batrachochytrium salamandrivorans]|nr:hypothetical protein BASA81_015215 [Batrachochytrium salamandrivorans]KAH9267087.1 hypothetical protein BASA84_000812 [Batrachochytrium salamandrivorans]